jgi:hypothetical protein
MSERDKKLLFVAIPLLAIAAVVLFLFVIRPALRGGGPPSPPTDTTAEQPAPPTGTGTGAYPTGTGTTGYPTGGEQQVAAAVSWGGKDPREPSRSNPFATYTTRKVYVPPPPPPGSAGSQWPILVAVGAQDRIIGPEDIGLPDERIRRMAGMLHNGRVWAIYEIEGESYIVKPGDPVGDEIITAIGTDYLTLRSYDGEERTVPLERLSGYETPGIGGPTTGPYPIGGPGPPRPLAPPRPPTL